MQHDVNSYSLLDSGNRRKLEAFGPYRVIRPAPTALWRPFLNEKEWEGAAGRFIRDSAAGRWESPNHLAEKWVVDLGSYKFLIKPTGFGHMGLFPEQLPQWELIAGLVSAGANEKVPSVLNMFAYTGGATMAAAGAGATVCHLDASRGAISWAKENAELSGLDKHPIRWIADDVLKFAARERRRKVKYDAVILDPPSFGRGSTKEVWKIERDLPSLLELVEALLSDDAFFVMLSAHTPGFSPIMLENLLGTIALTRGGGVESGELFIPENSAGRRLPSGCFAVWRPLHGYDAVNR